MILSDDGHYIYCLKYPEYKPKSYLKLYKISIENGAFEELGSDIPITSEEIATNTNLYYNNKKNEFYCITQEFEKYGESLVKVYSLQNPPVSLSEMTYYEEKNRSKKYFHIYVTLILLITCCITVVIRKRKKYDVAIIQNIQDNHYTSSTEENLIQIPEEYKQKEITEVSFKNKNAIYLFGNFSVLDKDGKDITYMFSPKLKIIFIYILLHSTSGEGVMSSDMNDIFWPEKAGEKVKNLKGVTINHIRKILKELDGIELLHNKGRFILIFNENIYCDYLQFVHMLNNGVHGKEETKRINEFIKIWIRGKFLCTIDNELFDYYKHNVEETIISLVLKEMDYAYRKVNIKVVAELYNILCYVDPINEQGLFYIVCAYRKVGDTEKALKKYTSFANLYRKTMNETYAVKYELITPSSIEL